MRNVKDLVNKILWDKKEKPEHYKIGIIDRYTKEIEFLPFGHVEKIEGNFMVINSGAEICEVPLHRIRTVKRLGKTAWQRKIV